MGRYFPSAAHVSNDDRKRPGLPLSVLLQVIDEGRPEQRLVFPVPMSAEFTPERDGFVDRRADRVRRPVQLGRLVRVGQMLEERPEEADVAMLPGDREGALAQL